MCVCVCVCGWVGGCVCVWVCVSVCLCAYVCGLWLRLCAHANVCGIVWVSARARRMCSPARLLARARVRACVSAFLPQRERAARNVFDGFHEAPIGFAPTYRSVGARYRLVGPVEHSPRSWRASTRAHAHSQTYTPARAPARSPLNARELTRLGQPPALIVGKTATPRGGGTPGHPRSPQVRRGHQRLRHVGEAQAAGVDGPDPRPRQRALRRLVRPRGGAAVRARTHARTRRAGRGVRVHSAERANPRPHAAARASPHTPPRTRTRRRTG